MQSAMERGSSVASPDLVQSDPSHPAAQGLAQWDSVREDDAPPLTPWSKLDKTKKKS